MAPIIDEEKLDGPIQRMYPRAEDKFNAYNKKAVDVLSGPTAVTTKDFPETAFRQIMVNAILHRNYEGTNTNISFYWYNDRIEIVSPGEPFGDVTVDNFGKPGIRDCRNRNLADVIKNLNLMQRYGFGIPLARQTMQENGNPPIEFDVDEHFVRVILRKRG
jgi:ATP-dependent DNA helicase RecG